MLRQVNLGAIHAQGAADFGGGALFDDVEVVDGVVGGIDLAFDAGEGFAQMQVLPFGIPKRFEWSGRSLAELGGVIVRRPKMPGMTCPFAELVGDFPADDLEEPAFEGILGGIVLEIRHFLSDRQQGVLESLFGFVFVQTGAARDAQDESAVGFVELFPAGMVRILDGIQKTGSGWEWFVHGFKQIRCRHTDQP